MLLGWALWLLVVGWESIVVRDVAWLGLSVSGVGVRERCSEILVCLVSGSESIVVRDVACWGLGVFGIGIKEHCNERHGLAGPCGFWSWIERAMW